jgi:molybdate transport system substrate-binding protein
MTATARAAVLAAAIVGSVGALDGCARDHGPSGGERPLRVLAAASLAPVLDDLSAAPGPSAGPAPEYGYAASSTLARQIDAGAAADVFVSANPEWMDWLEKRGRLVKGSRRDGPGNSLALVAPGGRGFEWSPRSGVPLPDAFAGRLALADPSHVPAGIYAKQALEHAGWWDALADRVVPTLDVRAALTLVERGECGAGIVYSSDASSSGRCDTVALLPDDWHDPIRYVAAIVAGADTARAVAWLDAFGSPAAARTLQAHGFRAAPAPRPVP